MDDSMLAWVGGIGGALLGVAGGVFGTWAALRHARSPAERRRMWRFVAAVWLLVAGLLAGLQLLPVEHRWAAWPVYALLLVGLIAGYNRRAAGPGGG